MSLIGVASATIWLYYLARVPLAWRGLAMPFVLLTLPGWVWISPPTAFIHDVWAGQLVALSLACYGVGARRASVAAGLAAVLIREFALPFVVVMGVAALIEHERREAIAWAAVLGGFLVLLAWHVAQALPLMVPDVMRTGWLQFGGWAFALSTSRVNVLLLLAPGWLVALVVPFAWAGLVSWPTQVGRRVAAVVTIYLAAFTVIGRVETGIGVY